MAKAKELNRLSFIYPISYCIVCFFIFKFIFTSDESFYSLKRIAIINGILASLYMFFSGKLKRLRFLLLTPIIFFVAAYFSLFTYMEFVYGQKLDPSFVQRLLYPFNSGINGTIFLFALSLFVLLISKVVKLLASRVVYTCTDS